MLSEKQRMKLNQILSRVGDMGFKRRVVEILNGLDIQKGDKILDCGCGEGFYTMAISELFSDVKIVAFDHDKKIMGMAKKWVGKKKNVKWISSEIESGLPFKTNEFDKIILSEVLEHLPDDTEALKEVKRVMKRGALLAITVPSGNYPFFWDPLNFVREHLGLGHFSGANQFLGGIWSWNHLRLYTPEMLSNVVKKAGLKEVNMKSILRFVLPFNYWLLFLGKRLYTMLPVPKTVVKSLEKFEWRDEEPSSSLITKILKFPLDVVDKLNDKFPGTLKNRQMCLFVLVVK